MRGAFVSITTDPRRKEVSHEIQFEELQRGVHAPEGCSALRGLRFHLFEHFKYLLCLRWQQIAEPG